uniref:Birch protein n=1 Tax=Betula platyphylla TaxID=78630 RepID=A0A9E9L7L3_BETPL|nr:birch protein [Betula platyphylla]
MGIAMNTTPPSSVAESHYNTHKVFLFCNYILLGAASSCIFLTLSLRLLPSISGFFLILLHVFTIAGAVSGCAAASSGTSRWYAAHMVTTVLTAIFQGSVSVLIFTRTGDFLGQLKSYVREEDGAVILKLGGGLSVLIFCLEWVVLTLAFFLKYYAYVEGDGAGANSYAMRRSAKVQQEEDLKDWPWPFQSVVRWVFCDGRMVFCGEFRFRWPFEDFGFGFVRMRVNFRCVRSDVL